MTTIEAMGTIEGHKISWLYDADNESLAVRDAKHDFRLKGLQYRTYVLVG